MRPGWTRCCSSVPHLAHVVLNLTTTATFSPTLLPGRYLVRPGYPPINSGRKSSLRQASLLWGTRLPLATRLLPGRSRGPNLVGLKVQVLSGVLPPTVFSKPG